MSKKYDIKIEDFNSAGIREIAEMIGAKRMRCIGCGAYLGRDTPDDYICFYALPHPGGWEVRVADTAGDPVWEDEDPQGFSELAQACGVDIK